MIRLCVCVCGCVAVCCVWMSGCSRLLAHFPCSYVTLTYLHKTKLAVCGVDKAIKACLKCKVRSAPQYRAVCMVHGTHTHRQTATYTPLSHATSPEQMCKDPAGATTQCAMPKCNFPFHVTCAIQSGHRPRVVAVCCACTLCGIPPGCRWAHAWVRARRCRVVTARSTAQTRMARDVSCTALATKPTR